MCMIRVDYATILTEPLRAWKAFRLSPDGRLCGTVTHETEYPRGEWLEAKPGQLINPRRYRHWMRGDDGSHYLMGFHAYSNKNQAEDARAPARMYTGEVILPVLLRGIAYHGVHDYGICGDTIYGWCAQEMFIDAEAQKILHPA